MLLGDLIATLDDESVAMEALMELNDLTLVRRASEAARGVLSTWAPSCRSRCVATSTRRRPTSGRP